MLFTDTHTHLDLHANARYHGWLLKHKRGRLTRARFGLAPYAALVSLILRLKDSLSTNYCFIWSGWRFWQVLERNYEVHCSPFTQRRNSCGFAGSSSHRRRSSLVDACEWARRRYVMCCRCLLLTLPHLDTSSGEIGIKLMHDRCAYAPSGEKQVLFYLVHWMPTFTLRLLKSWLLFVTVVGGCG